MAGGGESPVHLREHCNSYILRAVLGLLEEVQSLRFFKAHVLPEVAGEDSASGFDNSGANLAALLQVVDRDTSPHIYEAVVSAGPGVTVLSRLLYLMKTDPVVKKRVPELRRYIHGLCDVLVVGNVTNDVEMSLGFAEYIDIRKLISESGYEDDSKKGRKGKNPVGKEEQRIRQDIITEPTKRDGLSMLKSLLVSLVAE